MRVERPGGPRRHAIRFAIAAQPPLGGAGSEDRPTSEMRCSRSQRRPTCSSRAFVREWPSGSGSVPRSASSAIPRLVYARMTGWGQTGPARAAASATISISSVSRGCCIRSDPTDGKPVVPLECDRRFRWRRPVARLRRDVRGLGGAPQRPGSGGRCLDARRSAVLHGHVLRLPAPWPVRGPHRLAFPGRRRSLL